MYRIRDMRYIAGETYARHAHDELQISIVLRGAYEEDAHGALNRGGVADVVFKPAGTLHSDVFSETRILCIDGPAPELELGGYAWHRGDAVTRAALQLAHRFFDGRDAAEDLDELFAALTPRSCRDHVLATRAAKIIEETFAGPRTIARELHVHPVHLARVFRARWDCTPREYLQRMRVRAAAHAAASSRASLAEIALDCGFSDQAHMTRVFGRIAGITPAAMRRLARA